MRRPTVIEGALLVIAFILIWGFIGMFGYLPTGNFPHTMSIGWQAVFLNNNQTYFGKLEDLNHDYVTLSNVYYLRAGDLQSKDDGSANLSLVKLGGELHGPEDVMYIRKDSILFWENMKDNSRVLQLIHGMK